MSERLDVVNKAIDLMNYTLTITSNRKRYPVKHLILVRRIQERCMDIYESLLMANRINLDTSNIFCFSVFILILLLIHYNES